MSAHSLSAERLCAVIDRAYNSTPANLLDMSRHLRKTRPRYGEVPDKDHDVPEAQQLRFSEAFFCFRKKVMSYTENPGQDPVMLRRVLTVLDGMVKRMEEGGRIEILDGKTILDFVRSFGREYRQMRPEQDEERALLVALDSALKAKRATDFIRGSRRLSFILRDYLHAEDVHTVYPPAPSTHPEMQAG